MKDKYVKFGTAKLLKEKGFDWGCNGHWYIGETKTFEISPSINPINWNEVKTDLDWLSCPTQQMACDWVEKAYGFFIEISRSIDLNGGYHYFYMILDKGCKYASSATKDNNYSSKSDAVDAALEYVLRNLI